MRSAGVRLVLQTVVIIRLGTNLVEVAEIENDLRARGILLELTRDSSELCYQSA